METPSNTPAAFAPFTLKVPFAALRAVRRFVSTDETRYALLNVALEYSPGRVIMIGLDGRRLLAVQTVPSGEALPTKSFVALLSAQMIDQLDPHSEILGLEFDLAATAVRFPMGRGIWGTAPLDQANYPDWRSVIPTAPAQPLEHLHVNASLLREFAEGFEELSREGRNLPSVAITWRGHGAFLLRGTQLVKNWGLDILGLLMGVRANERLELDAPSWATRKR